MTDERDLAGEATERDAYLRRLRADISVEEANEEAEERAEREAYWDDRDEPFDDPVCARCHDDGMDPWNDYMTPCPACQSEQCSPPPGQ